MSAPASSGWFCYLLACADGTLYAGITTLLERRLAAHNAGQSPPTSKFKPWRLVTYLAFTDPEKALAFERYLKSGSGHAFARKRLW